MTPPADKPMDRSEVVAKASWVLRLNSNWPVDSEIAVLLARAVLEMDEELRKREEPKP